MIQKPTLSDPIIDEIHRTRREISDRFGGDLHAIVADARKRQEASGRPTWQRGAENHPLHRSDESGGLPIESQSSPPGDR